MADSYLVAVASTEGRMIDQHFGKSEAFRIFRVEDDERYSLAEVRNVAQACGNCGEHDDNRAALTARALSDCKYVLCSKIGPGSWRALEAFGVNPLEITHFIDYALDKLMKYDKKFMRRVKR